MDEKIKEISDTDFQSEVLSSSIPVVVDFYADWCSPCKMISQSIEELSEEFSNQIKVVKANIEINSSSVKKFNITGIPALLIFKNGELIDQHIGLRSKKEIRKDIEGVFNVKE